MPLLILSLVFFSLLSMTWALHLAVLAGVALGGRRRTGRRQIRGWERVVPLGDAPEPTHQLRNRGAIAHSTLRAERLP